MKQQKEENSTRRVFQQKKRPCRFCEDPTLVIDYKDARALRAFITERGKILPRRITGNCAIHQRKITRAVKRARVMALLPFTSTVV